tara:strand:- start:4803 stop:5369 length:567 start_codon:yes stop_codon:yes gene_type:complete
MTFEDCVKLASPPVSIAELSTNVPSYGRPFLLLADGSIVLTRVLRTPTNFLYDPSRPNRKYAEYDQHVKLARELVTYRCPRYFDNKEAKYSEYTGTLMTKFHVIRGHMQPFTNSVEIDFHGHDYPSGKQVRIMDDIVRYWAKFEDLSVKVNLEFYPSDDKSTWFEGSSPNAHTICDVYQFEGYCRRYF